jgi:hypothetical protein
MNARLLSLALVGATLVLTACGGSGGSAQKPKGAPGSVSNPLVGKLTEPAAAPNQKTTTSQSGEPSSSSSTQGPGYQKLLERQTAKPKSQFTPCNLVSQSQAQTILGKAIQAPLEAPQGPTCIYRTRDNAKFVTVAVQSVPMQSLRKQLRGTKSVAVSGHAAYCGVYGQPMLYAGLKDGRVLAVGARCNVARQFAARAVRELEG